MATLLPLPVATARRTGFTHKCTLTYEDVAALGDNATGHIHILGLTADTIPAGSAVTRVAWNLTTPFTVGGGTTATALTCAIADEDAGTTFVSATETAAVATHVHYVLSNTAGALTSASSLIASFELTAGAGDAHLAHAATGQLDIYMQLISLEALQKY
jgi:hypothetical protein